MSNLETNPVPATAATDSRALARLVGMVRDPVMRDAARAIAYKAAGALLALGAFALAARGMSKEAFGAIVIWFNLLNFAVVLAQAGQETFATRSWHEHTGSGRLDLARGALVLAFTTVATTGFVIGSAAALGALAAGYGTTLAVLAYATVQTLVLFSVAIPLSRAIVGVDAGDGHGEVTWRLCLFAGCAAFLATGEPLGAAAFLGLALAGYVLSLSLQAVAVARTLPEAMKHTRAAFDFRSWRRRSPSLWASSLVDATGQHLEVILVGLLLGPTSAAGYFAAGRLAAAFAMLSGGITNFAMRVVGKGYYSGRIREIQSTLRKLAAGASIAVLVGVAGIAWLGQELLSLFGPGYDDYYTTLLLLAAGTGAFALGGPASAIIVLTGHEKTHAIVLGTAVAARLAAVSAAAVLYGAEGAAFAYCLSMALTAVVLVVVARRRVGLDPSILSFVRPAPVESGSHVQR